MLEETLNTPDELISPADVHKEFLSFSQTHGHIHTHVQGHKLMDTKENP